MGSCPSTETIEIIQGEDREFDLTLDGVDLSDFTEVEVRLEKDDGTVLSLLESASQVVVESEDRGDLKVILTDVQTTDLKAGDDQDMEVKVTYADTTIDIVQIKKRLNVVARLFES
jgi:hypothetical protein